MPGVPVARVVAVIAEMPSGEADVGSGYLLDATHVLTAWHCTIDSRTGQAAAGLKVMRAKGGTVAPAELDEAAPGLDVALLTITGDPPWDAELPGGQAAFGSLDREHAGQLDDCEAVGFPRWQMSKTGDFRDVAEVHGVIRATEGREAQRLVLRDPVLQGVSPDGGSAWAGFSGAAVFHGGLLLGVIIEHHARQGETALQIRPVEAIAQAGDDAARRLAEALGIHRAGALRPVPAQKNPWRPTREVPPLPSVPPAHARPASPAQRHARQDTPRAVAGLLVILAGVLVAAAVIVIPKLNQPTGNPVVYDGDRYGFQLPSAIAADGNHIWVADRLNAEVTEINALTGARIGVLDSRHITPGPDTLADDGRHIWVGSPGSMAEFSAIDRKWIRDISYPNNCPPYPADFTEYLPKVPNYSLPMVAGGKLWVSNYGCTDRVDTFDLNSGRLMASFHSNTYGFQDMTAMVADGQHVWGTAAGGDLVELDPRSGKPIRVMSVDNSDTTWPDGIASYGTRIWILGSGVAYEVDSRSAKLEQAIQEDDYGFGMSAGTGDDGQSAADRVAMVGGHIFTVDGQGNYVAEFDAATGARLHVFSGAAYGFSYPVAITSSGDHIWVLSKGQSASRSALTELSIA